MADEQLEKQIPIPDSAYKWVVKPSKRADGTIVAITAQKQRVDAPVPPEATPST